MKTWSFLLLGLGAAWAAGPLAAAPVAAATPAKPNVLLIVVDDFKPLTGSYGDPYVKTPHLDRLAARGVQFDLGYCNQAVCGPSRYNLMLGTRSTSSGLYHFGRAFRGVYPDAVTLPQQFMRHGYRTDSLGKVFHVGHGQYDDPASWNGRVMKGVIIEYASQASTHGGKLTREEALFGNVKTEGPVRNLPRGAAWEDLPVPDDAYTDAKVAAAAVARLEEAKGRPQEPFFLAVGFARPHLPFVVPKKYWDLYDPAKLPLAANPLPPRDAPPYALKRIMELNQYDPVPEQPPLDEALQRKLIQGYYASTSYMDAQVGRVLDALDRLGLADNTLVLLWGDNGYSLGTHGDWTKHTNFEETNHIPFIFAGPGIARGARTKAMIETVDIYPTLCALAGLPAPQGPQPIDGLSQAPVLRDPQRTVKDHVYHAFPKGRPAKGGEWLGRAIRTARYRLVEWRPADGSPAEPEFELYDYVADPLETTNIAAKNATVLAEMRALLARHPAAKPPVKPSAADAPPSR